MIKIRKMGGDEIYINADLIESIKETPDTVITLTTDKKILVQDSVEDIIDKTVEYHCRLSSADFKVPEE